MAVAELLEDDAEAVTSTKLVLCNLTSRPELNGKPVIVDGFNSERRRWNVRLAAQATSGISVTASSLTVCVSSVESQPKAHMVEEAAAPRTWFGSEQWMLRVVPGCRFVAGQTITEERPLVLNELEPSSGDYDLAEALTAFHRLPKDSRARLLALNTSGESFVSRAGGERLDAESVVRRVGAGASVPPGEEPIAARFLRILDANAFQLRL